MSRQHLCQGAKKTNFSGLAFGQDVTSHPDIPFLVVIICNCHFLRYFLNKKVLNCCASGRHNALVPQGYQTRLSSHVKCYPLFLKNSVEWHPYGNLHCNGSPQYTKISNVNQKEILIVRLPLIS